MFRRLFGGEEHAEFADQVEKWGAFILANILWSILSVFVITIPAATAGMFAVMSERVRGKPSNVFHQFFGAVSRLWLKATLLMGINLLIGGLIALNLAIFAQMDMSDPFAFVARSVTIAVAAAALLVNLYAWSLLVVVDAPLKSILAAAFKLAFAYPLWSIGVLIAAAVPVVISLVLPQGIFVLATVSACVLIINLGTWRIIRRHLPSSELSILESSQA